jgi:hypothetical protein
MDLWEFNKSDYQSVPPYVITVSRDSIFIVIVVRITIYTRIRGVPWCFQVHIQSFCHLRVWTLLWRSITSITKHFWKLSLPLVHCLLRTASCNLHKTCTQKWEVTLSRRYEMIVHQTVDMKQFRELLDCPSCINISTDYCELRLYLIVLYTSCTRHALQCQSKTPLPLDIAWSSLNVSCNFADFANVAMSGKCDNRCTRNALQCHWESPSRSTHQTTAWEGWLLSCWPRHLLRHGGLFAGIDLWRCNHERRT